MNSAVTIVDYGVGNLRSVGRAVEKCGARPVFATSASDVTDGGIIILPGVGAFGRCIETLQQKELYDAVLNVISAGRPSLGICVGMQMLFEESEEFGRTPGFAVIPGKVEAIPATTADGTAHKIPHIGWGALEQDGNDWSGTILADVMPGDTCYFVHSFAGTPGEDANRLARCVYNGRDICAAVRKENIYGVQFHPEKSGPVGLRILSRFIQESVTL